MPYGTVQILKVGYLVLEPVRQGGSTPVASSRGTRPRRWLLRCRNWRGANRFYLKTRFPLENP